MLLKSITLKNIRSYTQETVGFPEGLTVFTGDVGSGKSTLLYAIEFAFFGATSDQPLNYLLRHGENKGSVELLFEVNGKEYTVYREIEKKDDKYSSSKKGNWIKYKGARVNYTPSEMKEQVLKTLLKFNESLATRASSVIYRFAVFTPQEEMKRILEQNSEDRLKTLRRAFRIEDYKLAHDNSKVITNEMGKDRKKLEGMGADLPEKKRYVETKQKEKMDQEEELRRLAKKIKKLEDDVELKKVSKEELEKLEREKQNLERYHESTMKDVENLRSRLKRIRDELNEVDEARTQMEELAPRLEELDRVKEELEALEVKRAEYEAKSREVLGMEKDKEALVNRVKELAVILAKAPELKTRVKDLAKNISRGEKARSKTEENKENMVKLGSQLEHAKTIWGERFQERENFKDLEGQAKCPKCGQELTPEHMEKVVTDLEAEMKALEKDEKGYTKDIAKTKERIEKYSMESKDLETEKEELHRIQGELHRLETEGTRLKELRQQADGLEVSLKATMGTLRAMAVDDKRYSELKSLRNDLEQLARRYVMARSKVEKADKLRAESLEIEGDLSKKEEKLGDIGEELETVLERYDETGLEDAKKGFEEAREALANADKQAVEHRTRIEHFSEDIKLVNKEIEKKKGYLEQAKEHLRAEGFVKDCFMLALDVIEKHVMASINEEFEVMLQKWFNMLIESPDLNVRVDDSFTPIIEQDGYELDHWALSGGERTSVALAYRLALNAMVKATSTTMKENLLILDEPTDGFSREQMSRVREVLEELRSDQCIIVTHERELEGFADKVFRVVKEGGVSRVVD